MAMVMRRRRSRSNLWLLLTLIEFVVNCCFDPPILPFHITPVEHNNCACVYIKSRSKKCNSQGKQNKKGRRSISKAPRLGSRRWVVDWLWMEVEVCHLLTYSYIQTEAEEKNYYYILMPRPRPTSINTIIMNRSSEFKLSLEGEINNMYVIYYAQDNQNEGPWIQSCECLSLCVRVLSVVTKLQA